MKNISRPVWYCSAMLLVLAGILVITVVYGRIEKKYNRRIATRTWAAERRYLNTFANTNLEPEALTFKVLKILLRDKGDGEKMNGTGRIRIRWCYGSVEAEFCAQDVMAVPDDTRPVLLRIKRITQKIGEFNYELEFKGTLHGAHLSDSEEVVGRRWGFSPSDITQKWPDPCSIRTVGSYPSWQYGIARRGDGTQILELSAWVNTLEGKLPR